MTKGVTERFLSFVRIIFFEVITPKFNSAPFKNFMDYAYVIFEKFAYSFEILSSNYLKLYDELVEKEIKMAKISNKSNILIIGCGSLPATTALVGMKTNANIVAIDYDYKAIHKASIFIKNLNLESNIKIGYADGLKYPLKKFDVLFVLYGVKRQKEMLKHLSKNIESNTLVVFRTTQDILDQKFGGAKFLSDLFIVKDFLSSESIYTSDSYLLSKKK